ncbi:MAG: ATP-binding cassette domain-containing protein [Alphaproteobacteria bacterium]|nr:ATP-binding cassette domain-containing protein [Alphaproteobacteria bacterium]
MWPFVKPYWGRALLAALITIPIGCLDAVIALTLKPFMNIVIMGEGKESGYPVPLWVIPIFIILFTLFQSFLDYASSYLNTWVGSKITIDLKKKLYKKLVYFESAFFDKTSSGNIVYRFDTDPNLACSGLLNNLKVFVSRIFSTISLVGVLLYTSWQLAIIAITVMSLSFYPLTHIRRMIKDVVKKTTETSGEVLTAFNETYAGAKTITSYNLQKYEMGLFEAIQKKLFKLTIKQTQRTAWLSPMMHVIVSFGIAGVIWTGSYLITSGRITAGDFVAFMTAMLMLYTPVKNIGKNFNSVQLSFMAIERVFEILEEKVKIKNSKDAVPMPPLKKSIEFKNVDFEYVEGTPVLQNINLTLKKGQTIAFVGNSGGGKSTIINLIPRFYDITAGQILFDGEDIRQFDLESLRSQIAVVFQDNFLFSGTIRDNIMLGKPDATKEEVEKAVEMACLSEFVDELELGLDTPIGERGTLLSGGQRQRVAIARAFLKNAPIVILDEATSALDNKSEAVVQQAINNLMQNKTVFIIAHRLSTVQNADKIIVLNEGKVVEQGTHEELLNKVNGAYKALYMVQFNGK